MQDHELALEIEALNSIYGVDTLSPLSHDDSGVAIYILKLPVTSTTLRLGFPLDYPASPPIVYGSQSSGDGSRRGEAVRLVQCFKDVLGQVFISGEVVLYDAIEEFQAREEGRQSETSKVCQTPHNQAASLEERQDGFDPPEWVVGEPILVQKSTFLGHATGVTNPSLIKVYIAHLLTDSTKKRLRLDEATHNISAWRVCVPPSTSCGKEVWHEDYDDDGEGGAGRRVLQMLQLMNVENCLVVISRWFGGIKLGGRRFGCVVESARGVIVKGGWGKESQKKHHGKT